MLVIVGFNVRRLEMWGSGDHNQLSLFGHIVCSLYVPAEDVKRVPRTIRFMNGLGGGAESKYRVVAAHLRVRELFNVLRESAERWFFCSDFLV